MIGYVKVLTANDLGITGSHQSGICIPKKATALVSFLPTLRSNIKNPSTPLICVDTHGREYTFRYIHYNNKLHEASGTRDEYRITRTTEFFRIETAQPGDQFEIYKTDQTATYQIRLVRQKPSSELPSAPIVLRGWRRIH